MLVLTEINSRTWKHGLPMQRVTAAEDQPRGDGLRALRGPGLWVVSTPRAMHLLTVTLKSFLAFVHTGG